MGSGRGAARHTSPSTNYFWRYLCGQIKFFINQLEERRREGCREQREKRQRPSARRELRMNRNHQQNTAGHSSNQRAGWQRWQRRGHGGQQVAAKPVPARL